MNKHFVKIKDVFDGFLSWWIAELSLLVPKSILVFFYETKGENWIKVSPGGIEVISVSGDGEKKEYFKGNSPDIFEDAVFQNYLQQNVSGVLSVLLSEDYVLERVCEFPKFIKKDFKNVIGFELPRLLPMELETIYFDCKPIEDSLKDDFVDFKIAMIKKTVADKFVNALEKCGMEIKRFCALSDDQNLDRFELLNLEGKYQKKKKTLASSLMIATCVLTMISIWSVSSYYDKRRDFLNNEIRNLSQSVAALSGLRDQIKEYDRKQALFNEAINKIKLDQILEILTRSIPEDSWVYDYQQSTGELTITGVSKNTGDLIANLNNNDHFKNVNNRSSTFQNNHGQSVERFTISFEVDVIQPGGDVR